jgi:DNA-directed RNA polymerase specialized sigma24 family protein
MTANRVSVNTGEEQILLVAGRAGDEHAFGRLASRYRPGLDLFCRLMLGCPREADDAVCETLLRGWSELRRGVPSA